MRSSNLTPCVGIQTWGVKLDPGVTDLQSGVSAGKASGQTGQGLLCSHLLLQESQLLLAACHKKQKFCSGTFFIQRVFRRLPPPPPPPFALLRLSKVNICHSSKQIIHQS